MGYRGFEFINSIASDFGKELEIVKRPRKSFWVPEGVTNVEEYLSKLGYHFESGFKVQPKRWIVERTFAWLGKFRRLSKDYEFKIKHSESFIYLAMIKIMMGKIMKIRV